MGLSYTTGALSMAQTVPRKV